MYHFASRGWLCVQPNYRLCPDATFPDQLVDIKRAIAWVHDHAAEHGGDPQPDLPHRWIGRRAPERARGPHDERSCRFQPGFEDADTSVVAAMPLYGDYDWLDSHGERADVASIGRSTSPTRS